MGTGRLWRDGALLRSSGEDSEPRRDPGAAREARAHRRGVHARAHALRDRLGDRRAAPLRAPHLAHLDAELVRAGCLLHDIGVYRLYGEDGRLDHGNYIRHGPLGHEIFEAEGFPETLRGFCSHHTGVGLTRRDIVRQELPLPPADYLAVTQEERLVMYADKCHTKSRPSTFLSPDEYAAHVRRFGEDKVIAFQVLRAEFGEPDLTGPVPGFGTEEDATAAADRG
ncbi:HD domain-containing protein [Streptomyces massasporeus]|uniref:HD domain-containing protein n=1 Tax=Streptomyces massasporeus TaxID=67324 RepID=UPI0033CF5DD0